MRFRLFTSVALVAILACVLSTLTFSSGDLPPTPASAVPSPERIAVNGGGLVLNVKDKPFGAVGDGVTNDAPAINKALDLARKTGEYGQGVQGTVVYIPPGIYRLDSPVDLNGLQFNVVGAGSFQT